MSIIATLFLVVFLVISLSSKENKAKVNGKQSAPADAAPSVGKGDMFREEKKPCNVASPYFTYEADNENIYRPQNAKARAAATAPAMNVPVEAPVSQQFDLRQAVVSQVILNNKYIDEIN